MFSFLNRIRSQNQEIHQLLSIIDVKDSEIEGLKQAVHDLKKRIGDPKEVVKKTFAKDLAWFDYEDLPPSERDSYFQEARSILRSKVFNNEMNYLKTFGLQHMILDSEPETAQQQVRDFQMTINGFELLESRLKEIKEPNQPTPQENTFEAI